MINRFTFPVDTDSPYAVKRMAEYLQTGGKLVLFPEGRLSRTGAMMKLFDGTGFLLFKTNAKVITCYLRGAHRLPFSPNPNRKKWFPRVTAHFGESLDARRSWSGHEHDAGRAKNSAALPTTLMVKQQFDIEMEATPKNVLAAILETARQCPNVVALEDVTRRQADLPALCSPGPMPWRGNGASAGPMTTTRASA